MEIDIRKTQIYYINLDEHQERNLSFINKMKQAGFEDSRISRIAGIRKDGIQKDSVYVGCFHSQLKTLKKALQGPFPFMILEDDCEINQVPESIDVPDDGEAVYIGISAWGFTPAQDGNLASLNGIITDRVNSDIVRVFNMLSSHAIMYLSKEYVESLIEDLESNLSGKVQVSNSSEIPLKYHGGVLLPCDVIMANKQYNSKVYSLRNPIFYQGDKHQYCTLFKI